MVKVAIMRELLFKLVGSLAAGMVLLQTSICLCVPGSPSCSAEHVPPQRHSAPCASPCPCAAHHRPGITLTKAETPPDQRRQPGASHQPSRLHGSSAFGQAVSSNREGWGRYLASASFVTLAAIFSRGNPCAVLSRWRL